MSYTVCPLSYATLEDAQKLQASLFSGLTPYEQTTLALSLTTKTPYFNYLKYWVVVQDGVLLGMIGLYRHKCNGLLYIGWFGVDVCARGKGVGKRLLTFAITKARSMQAPSLHLYTQLETSKEAVQLYEQQGFKKYMIKDGYTYFKKELNKLS